MKDSVEIFCMHEEICGQKILLFLMSIINYIMLTIDKYLSRLSDCFNEL